MAEDWLDAFPPLKNLDGETAARLRGSALRITLPAGASVFTHGSPCRTYPFVVSGSIRVQMISEGGREIVLYRVGRGETCVLTTSCLLAGENYPAEAITESEVAAAILPAGWFQDLLARSAPFRAFIFQTYGRRITSLMLLIEEVAFRRVDVRLAEQLIDRCGGPGGALAITHQQLAAELGSVREVVSRQLKEFERRGWLALRRGRIDRVDVSALRNFLERASGATSFAP
jgi:CRP/FNR family transcriptional regulator, anaerobic regulatory protein